MTQILLAVIALGASIMALYAVHTTKEVYEELQIRIDTLTRQADMLSHTNTVIHSTDNEIIDLLHTEIRQQKQRLTNLNNKHEHLRCVVLERIQREEEADDRLDL